MFEEVALKVNSQRNTCIVKTGSSDSVDSIVFPYDRNLQWLLFRDQNFRCDGST
jgi:hypothetical protein